MVEGREEGRAGGWAEDMTSPVEAGDETGRPAPTGSDLCSFGDVRHALAARGPTAPLSSCPRGSSSRSRGVARKPRKERHARKHQDKGSGRYHLATSELTARACWPMSCSRRAGLSAGTCPTALRTCRGHGNSSCWVGRGGGQTDAPRAWRTSLTEGRSMLARSRVEGVEWSCTVALEAGMPGLAAGPCSSHRRPT